MSLITFHHWWFSEVHSLCSMCLLCEYMVHKHYAEYWILLLLICMWAELLQNLARVFVFFPAGCHLLPNSDTIHQRDLASTNLLAAWESVKLVPTVRRRSRLHTVLILSPLFFFFFEYPSGWHRFWLLHISPILLVGAFWKQEWHFVVGWWRVAMLGQTGWGLGCHCKQSSAYSWNEMTLWQWLCFAFEAACLFWTVNPLASTSSPAAPPSSLPPLTAEVRLQRASLSYLHIKKQDLSSTFSHSYRNPEGIEQTLIWW